jgi:hypothetical protein
MQARAAPNERRGPVAKALRYNGGNTTSKISVGATKCWEYGEAVQAQGRNLAVFGSLGSG